MSARRHAALRLATAWSATACRACDRGGNIRNLGYVGAETITNLKTIVFSGAFKPQGMPDFTGKLKDDDVVKINAFIQGVADSIRPK